MKFIFITGGVLSSLGKGLASASIGALLEARGLSVNFLKLDPYINVDPGTMSPFQHGEVFVTDDGAETDLDLGHYERFGICLGMQCALIEFARNVCGLQADSSEFDPDTQHPVFFMLRDLLNTDIMGGNMRLGAFPCRLDEDSLAYRIYGRPLISERHRHRYEFNRQYEEVMSGGGMRFTGSSPDSVFIEIMELPGHPWFLGCQFHPEFKSKPLKPHPLLASFIGASYRHKRALTASAAVPAPEGIETKA